MVSSPATWDGKKMRFFMASVKGILRSAANLGGEIMTTGSRPLTLLEREPAVDALGAALAEAAAGQGRVALVYGEAGIGKTSLVTHFTRERAGMARALWGACDSLHTPRPCTTSPRRPARGCASGSRPPARRRGAGGSALGGCGHARPGDVPGPPSPPDAGRCSC